MDHVGAGLQHADVLADRNDQLVVHRQQPELAGLQLVVRDDVAGEVDVVLVGVGVFPVPLMPGHLDRQVGVARAVLVIDQAERRDRHHHQDQHRDHRPGDLEHRVVRGAARHRIALGVVAPHHPDQQAGDEQRDQGDDHQHQVVQLDLLLLQRPEGRLHAHFPGPRRADRLGQRRAAGQLHNEQQSARRAAAGIATSADPSRFGPPSGPVSGRLSQQRGLPDRVREIKGGSGFALDLQLATGLQELTPPAAPA